MKEKNHAQSLPNGFQINGALIYAAAFIGRGSKPTVVAIASQITVVADTCDKKGVIHGRLLEWRTRSNQVVRWVIPWHDITSSNTNGLLMTLLDLGVPYINLAHKKLLAEYLKNCQPNRRIVTRSAKAASQTIGGMGLRVTLKGFRFDGEI